MKKLVLLLLLCPLGFGQAWTPFIDSSRAIDWSSAGFTIPNYTTLCTTQPTLTGNSSPAAAANSTSIQNALASCDATHNVVNIPSGTYYVAGINYPDHGNQVLRGAGANSTFLISTGQAGCAGAFGGICLSVSTAVYDGNGAVLPPSGTQQCQWTAGYSQGTTSITLSSCGGTPPLNSLLILDQADDTVDNSGVYVCDSATVGCTYNTSGNHIGRVISGAVHSLQQVVHISTVTALGGGSYTVTFTPGLYFTNVRSGQSPGAWWAGTANKDGLENLSIDGTLDDFRNISVYACYQCWVKGVASSKASRDHIGIQLSLQTVIRDNYLYSSQNTGAGSYAIENGESSGTLIENNILQQTTAPIMFSQTAGSVIDYNFSIDNQFPNNFVNGSYSDHDAGSAMNLWEGNSFVSIQADDAWGSSDQQTYFRNMVIGWAIGRTNSTFPIMMRSHVRNFNLVGNVFGQPGYHTNYQSYATSTTGGVNQALENHSIYTLGWGGTGATCNSPVPCDPFGASTLMRWGNYDTVTAGTTFDSTEASPAAVQFVNANFTSGYFGSLAHTLPASLYYSAKPLWWTAGKNWPPIGPDVSTGNVGTCSGGTYSGAQATNSSQCTAGTLSTAWASHVTSIPAQDCFLNTMGGAADGSGSILSFNASTCFSASVGTVSQTINGVVQMSGSAVMK